MVQTALITGASSGLGKEFANIHASYGGNLILISRSEDTLQKLKEDIEKQYNVAVLVISKDLIKENSAKEIYDEVLAQNLQVDYLINNAGFGGIGNFHERDLATEV